MAAMGSAAHQSLIGHVVAHYHNDPRVRAVAVFGSVSTGAWHELSDVDFDVVVTDDAAIDPAGEARALFGAAAVIVIAGRRLRRCSARLARGGLHPLAPPSRHQPEHHCQPPRRHRPPGRPWDAIVAVERARHTLTALCGRRDSLRLDPADPMGALARVVAEAAAEFDLGPVRHQLLERLKP